MLESGAGDLEGKLDVTTASSPHPLFLKLNPHICNGEKGSSRCTLMHGELHKVIHKSFKVRGIWNKGL